jgi:hypothetical protein
VSSVAGCDLTRDACNGPQQISLMTEVELIIILVSCGVESQVMMAEDRVNIRLLKQIQNIGN